MKKSTITIDVNLDENLVPETLEWSAEGAGVEKQETKAVFISVWDEEKTEALRLDLWTKDMPLEHMKIFFHQMMVSMAQTYERATNETEVADEIRAFAETYAVSAKIK